MILTEPEALLTPASKMPGLDGQKMSKSYHNTISLRERPDDVRKKLRTMPTDPARVRRTTRVIPISARSGSCTRCIPATRCRTGCARGVPTAGIGCLDCKQPVIDSVLQRAATDPGTCA